jgi:CRP/FNR family transcriptional regulator, cyclic AMP receptor protein
MVAMTCLTAQRPAEESVRKRGILRGHVLFSKLDPAHVDRLTPCLVTKSVRKGATIFAKGDPGSCLFAIGDGVVKISIPSVGGHNPVINLLAQGDIFGEIALLDARPRTADAIAMTDCQLFVIERRDLLPLLREEPDIALKLIEILCARLRWTTEQTENLMFLDLSARLAKALLRLASGGTPKVSITQQDLGDLIGMSRESTNRQLRKWEDNRWVRLERGGIVINSIEAISLIAEGDLE